MNNNNLKENNKKINQLKLIPVIIIIGILPLIMHYISIDTNMSQYNWYTLNDIEDDFFGYYKAVLFTIVTIAMAIILAYKYLSKSEKKKMGRKEIICFVCLLLYGVLAIVSTIMSQNKYLSLHGSISHFESIFILLGYIVTVLYCYIIIDTIDDIKKIVKGILICVAIMSIIGIFEYFGKNLILTSLGQILIFFGKYSDLAGTMENIFEKGRVTLTLYNPNYVGLYTAIMLPFFVVLIIFKLKTLIHNKEKIANKLYVELAIYLLIIIGLTVSLIGSKARNGIVAIVITALIAICFFRKKILSHWKILLVACLIFVASLIGVNSLSHSSLSQKLLSYFEIQKTTVSLQNIETNKDNVTIQYNDNKLIFNYEYTQDGQFVIHFLDEEGNVLDGLYDSASGILQDPRFCSFIFTPTLYSNGADYNNIVSIVIKIDGKYWKFTNQIKDGSYYYFNNAERPDKIKKGESAIFTNYEGIGSGRGYIWSRSIPILKDCIFYGKGPDTFAIAFPQQDYVAASNYNFSYSLIDKAHNMYIQVGIQTGMISLILMLLFFITYLVWCFKLYWNETFTSYLPQIGFAIMLSVIGFLVSALFNDSNINVSPIFWAMIGLGMNVNKQIECSKKVEC